MSKVRLEFAIPSGFKGIPDTLYVPVRNLRVDELARLDDDALMAACTGLSLDQAARLTANDRAAIVAARRLWMANNV